MTCHDHVEPMQRWHLNVFNKDCVIVCALPRGRLSNDGKVYRVTPPREGLRKNFTQEFEASAVTLMREMPVKRAGHILGESDTMMWRMLIARVKTWHSKFSFDDVVWVGSGEIKRRKGHNYLTVFWDLLAKQVLFGTPGKDSSVWEGLALELPWHNGYPMAIQHIAIDMSVAYTEEASYNHRERQNGVRQVSCHREWGGMIFTRTERSIAGLTPVSRTGSSEPGGCGSRTRSTGRRRKLKSGSR